MTTVKICVDVADLDEAGAFYCQALQCTEVGRNSRTVKLTAGGNELYLILRPEGSMPFLAAIQGVHSPDTGRLFTSIFPLRTPGGPHRRSPGSAESSRARSRATGAA
jgi:catechol 2,3-dioxygenase-like lactoylglutathione lyase family enzyme